MLQQLRVLVAVISEGSIGRAAARLHITQPALSRQIRRLEETLGVPVLERRGQGIVPTAAGSTIAGDSSELDARLRAAVEAGIESHLGIRGAVNVGAARGVLDGRRLGRALTRVRRELPHVRVHLAEIPSAEQAQALRDGRIDIAVGLADPEGDGTVKRELLYEDSVDGILVAPDHPLAMQPRLSMADLREFPLVALTPLRRVLHLVDAVDRTAAAPIIEQTSMEGVYAMVAAGAGWTFGMRAMHDPPPLGTVLRPARGLHERIAISLRFRAREASLAQQNVVRVIREVCGAAQPDPDAEARPAPITDPDHIRDRAERAVRDLSLDDLIAFAAAVDEGSVSAAAHRLRLTQSGVSRRLLALERVLGFPLLQRSGHGVRATDAGNALCEQLTAVLLFADGIPSRARLAARGVTSLCRVGTLPAEITGGMEAHLVRQVRERHPDIGMEIFEMLPERLVEALAERRIDIGIGGTLGQQPPPGMKQVVLADDVIDSALLSRDSALAGKSWLVPEDLRNEPFYFAKRSEAPNVYDALVQALRGMGLAPDPMFTHSGPRAVWAAVAGGRGWTIASRPERANPPAGLVAVPIAGVRIPAAITLLWRDEETNMVVQRVTEVIRAMPLPAPVSGVAAAPKRGDTREAGRA